MPVKLLLIDPIKQRIEELRISPDLLLDTIPKLVGFKKLKAAWIVPRAKLICATGPAVGYFHLPESPPIPGLAVIVGISKTGDFCDVPMSVSEVTAGVRWGQARPAKQPGTARHPEKAASGLPRGQANESVAGLMAKSA